MAKNEQETRFHLIDPVLRDKGYDEHRWLKCETPAPVEPTGNRGSRRRGGGRTDYLLCIQPAGESAAFPIAVLEAKPETADPLTGMQQARNYAECKRFALRYVFSSNGHRFGEFDIGTQRPDGPFPMNRFPARAELTHRYEQDSGIALAAAQSKILFQLDSPAYNKPRYYQDAAIRAAFENLALRAGRQAGACATESGHWGRQDGDRRQPAVASA
ncbi:MAG: hypothetical protein WCD66_14750 [Rhodanobacteraceae bacterium]